VIACSSKARDSHSVICAKYSASTDQVAVAVALVQENKRLGRQQVAAAAAGSSSSSTGQPDWLAAVGFDEEYLAQERLLGLQKGHVPPGYTYDDGMYNYWF
jgi:hypothetical protein